MYKEHTFSEVGVPAVALGFERRLCLELEAQLDRLVPNVLAVYGTRKGNLRPRVVAGIVRAPLIRSILRH